jgi:O-acetyl-ADP-ribose deacetylase (regulator of RNase III)
MIMIERKVNQSRIVLVEGDITKEKVDAIVNAANPSLMGGGGVDGAIHKAGGPAILEECKKIRERQGKLPTGQAVATTAGRLNAKYVIHTVGPVWQGGSSNEAQLLRSAYKESLKVAVEKGCRSVAFPSISTGVYGYPMELAAKEALSEVMNFLEGETKIEEIRFVLFGEEAYSTYAKVLEEL